jgi:hypothetical protein
LFTPTAAVFVEVGKSRMLRDSKLAADAKAYKANLATARSSVRALFEWDPLTAATAVCRSAPAICRSAAAPRRQPQASEGRANSLWRESRSS